jgi:thiol-disulfide isomerase/thioredoxin
MRLFLNKVFISGAVACAVVLAALSAAAQSLPKLELPKLELKDLQGGVHHLEDYKGKVIVLNFWATYCVPCATEMPLLNEMQKRYKDKIIVLAASLDDELDKAKLQPFLHKHNADDLTLMTGADFETLENFGLAQVLPGTVFIDAEGKIVDKVEGALKRADLEHRLAQMTGTPERKKTAVPQSTPSQAEWDWVNRKYYPVINELLPMKAQGGTYLFYRSHRDLDTDTLEYSFFVGHEPKQDGPGLQDSLTADVRVADSLSIYEQMIKMHRGKPTESVAAIKKKIKIREWRLNERTCPAIQTQFSKFKNLSLKPPEFDSIVLHPLVHQFHVVAGAGDMDISLVDEKHPLVLWALETEKTLDACIALSS